MWLCASTLQGQVLRVVSLVQDPMDATAATHEVLDANGDACALLRIRLVDAGVDFECDWIVRTENRGGNEYWVWLCRGTQSITIKSSGALPREVVFADHNPSITGLRAKNTYVLTLEKQQAQATVSVRIRCNAAGAEVKVDGYAVSLKKKIPMAPGQHHITATAPHHEPYSDTVTVSPYIAEDQVFEVSMESSVPREQYEAGMEHYSGKRYKEAAEQWGLAADAGHVLAQGWLGRLYVLGLGVEKDYAKAAKLLRPAAEAGEAEAQVLLGSLYGTGSGVPKDRAAAREWLTKAASQGNADGQYALASMLGDDKEYAEAAQWLVRAASRQHVKAQTLLGVYYMEGRGVQQDYSQAISWTRIAADQGFDLAQYNMGYIYYNGKGVEKNTAEAKKWFELAAAQGFARAQNMVAQINSEARAAASRSTAATKPTPSRSTAEQSGSQHGGEVYSVVDEEPQFPGGINALKVFLGENIRYPQEAREKNITGKVYVTFIVEKDGSVTNVKLLRDIGGGCGEEAVRVVKAMPKWRPGRQQGRAVRVKFDLPISFNLKSSD